jgi:hypothetical protein
MQQKTMHLGQPLLLLLLLLLSHRSLHQQLCAGHLAPV